MKLKTKRSVTFLSLILMIISLFSSTNIARAEGFSVAAKAAFSVDFDSEKVLYNQNADTPMGIASVTKILSLYVIYNQIEEGNISWETPVPISETTAALSVAPDLSNVPLLQEETYTVRELVEAAVIQSGNAAIVALGELVAGDEPAFVDMMKEQLASWNITDGKIVNSSGLNNSFLGDNIYPGSSKDDENELSARDVAIVAYHLIKDYPEILEISKTTSKMFGEDTNSPVEMVNWNWMLPGFLSEKDGVDGLKTGTTDFAGACFVGTMMKDGQRIITVVLNATNHDEDPAARFTETSRLMDYSYDAWSLEEIPTANQEVPKLAEVAVQDGKEETVSVSLKDNVQLWVNQDFDQTNLTITPTVDQSITAPLAKGTSVGTAAIALTDDELGYLQDEKITTTEIVTNQEVEKANIFVLGWRKVSNFFQNLF